MRTYVIIGVLGLGLGCWTTGAMSQSAGLVDDPQARAFLQSRPSKPSAAVLASMRSEEVAFKAVPAPIITSSKELRKK